MSKKPNYVFDTDDQLCHWGIKGQRWGDRRFQNEDGSLTPEGRERYGVGDRVRNFFKIRKSDQQIKADEQKAKAKISYNTQKYKADLKSKAQKEKDARAAEEERNRLKEQAKTEKMLKKEQGKIDRTAQKERNKTEQDGRPLGMKLTRTRKMSDEDLQKAIDRLKLQAEYNKQYVLATQPNGALAKADRFFEGPTGKMVRDIAVATLPVMATAATKAVLDSKLKYANKEDRDKIAADTKKVNAEAEEKLAKAESARATMASNKAKSESELKDADLKRKIDESNQRANLWQISQQNKRWNAESQADIARKDRESEQNYKLERSKQAVESYSKMNQSKAQSKMAELDRKIKEAEKFGYDFKPDAWSSHVNGSIQNNQNNQQTAMNTIRGMVSSGQITPSEGLDLMKKYGLLNKK